MAIFGIDIEYDGNGLSELDIAGETLVVGDLCYLGNDSKYYKASALAKNTSSTEVRMALANIPINTSGRFLVRGKFTKAGLTPGDKYYISESYGQFTNVPPNGTASNVIRYVGTAHSASVFEFNADATYILADGSELNEVTLAAGGGGAGHVIQDEGISLAARTNLNFIGTAVTVTDNPGNSATDVTIIDSGAHVHSNLALLETYDQTNVGISNAVTEAHNVFNLGSKVVNETGITNGDVLYFNSSTGYLEYKAESIGVTDHTLLTNIGTNTHTQIDTHIADTTLHYTQASISITESQISDLGNYEPALGNPAADGYVLTSTTGGVRSWANISAGGPEADTLDSVTTRGATTTNAISTGNISATGTIGATGNITGNGVTATIDPIIAQGDLEAYSAIKFDDFKPVSGTNLVTVQTSGYLNVITDNSNNWNTAYAHSLINTGNPHQVAGSQVALTGYTIPGSTSAVLPTDSTNAAIGKLEKAIEDITLSGGMVSFNVMEGNGTETASISNAETIHFEQGTGMQVEMTSTTGGAQLTFTNTAPNINLIHTGEVTGATALTISSNVVDLDNLIVGGTPAVNKYLRYDSAGSGLIWDIPPDTDTDTNTWRPIIAGGNTLGANETLTMSAGQAMAITESAGTVTFTANPSWDLEVNGVFKEAITQGENVSFDDGTGINITGTTVTNPNVTIGLATNGVTANELNVTGNGTSAQFLRSDGDGSFSWAVPVDTDTIYTGWDLYTNGVNRGNISSGENVNFASGTGMSLGYSATNNTMTSSIADNGVGATQLNVSGNGANTQFLRSDGDGSFSWAIPVDTDTVYGGWTLQTDGTNRGTIGSGEVVNFVPGSGLALSYSATNNSITFSTTTDSKYLRSNAADSKTSGDLTFNDNIAINLGTGADHEVYWDNTKTTVIWKMNSGIGLRLYDGLTKRFEFERSTGYFECVKSFATSDRNKKENIKPWLDSGLDLVNKIEVVAYDWKDGSGNGNIGAIAQDVPEEIASADKKSIDVYTQTFIQAKAIQELSVENDDLRKRLEKLERIIENKL